MYQIAANGQLCPMLDWNNSCDVPSLGWGVWQFISVSERCWGRINPGGAFVFLKASATRYPIAAIPLSS